jgi:hypothetical protein
MSFDYSVAIKLTVANLASQGLRLLAGDLFVASKAADNLKGKLSALKLVAVGYGMEKIGSGILGFLEKSVDASKEYTRQLSLMNAAGMTQKDIAEATAAAWKTSRDVITSTAADNLKSIRELRTVLGPDRLNETYGILPTVQRIKATLEALTGKAQDNVAFEVVKAVDLRTSGLMSGASLQRNADLMGRTLMGMGGTLDVHDYLMTLKYAKNSALSWSDEFTYDYLPTLMQEVKAGSGMMGNTSTAGTALRALSKVIVQGVIPKSAIPVWEEMGLIKPSDVVRNATGTWQIRPGGVAGAQLESENPLKWAEKYAPAIERYAAAHKLSLLQTVSAMTNQSNAQWALYTLLVKRPQFERDRKLIESGGNSYDTYQKLLQTNPQLAEQALHNQWQNILATIGFKILPRLIPYMIKFADTLDNVSQWMQDHPDLTNGIVFGLGGVAIAFSVLGKVLMTAGLIKFLGIGPIIARALIPLGVVGGVIALIGFAAYELWKHWDVIGPKLKAAWEAIRSGVSGLLDWMQQKWEWLTNLMHPKQRSGATGQWGGGATGSWDTPGSPNPTGPSAWPKPDPRNPIGRRQLSLPVATFILAGFRTS